jgi:hypothetical protein
MAASVLALKTARQSTVHPPRPNRVRAARAPPVKATCFKQSATEFTSHCDRKRRRVGSRLIGESKTLSDYPFMKTKLKPPRNGHRVCLLCARTGSRRRKRTRRMKMTRTVFAVAVAAMLMSPVSGASQAAPIAPLSGAGYRRPKQCDPGLLVSSTLVPPSLVSPSPSLLARLLRPHALPLVAVVLPTDSSNPPRRSLSARHFLFV